MFLSFIIPVYNVEKFLAECLDSLLDQDIPKEDYEILCINDGSTDGSLAILREYEARYANIRVIDKENGGVSSVRNMGIEAAKGDYVWMADSDDLIAHHFLGYLREVARSSDPDIIDFGAYHFHDELTEEERKAYYAHSLPALAFANNVYITRSLFKREFLLRNHMRFDTALAYSEDSLFKCGCMMANPRVSHEHKMGYLVRYRQGSAVSSSSPAATKRKYQSSRIASLRFREYYEKAEDALKSPIADLLMSNLWQTLYAVVGMNAPERRAQLKQLRADGLYPFVRPEACTLRCSYQTDRTDIVGKVYDKVYLNMHRPWGFGAMVLLRKLIDAKKKLVK